MTLGAAHPSGRPLVRVMRDDAVAADLDAFVLARGAALVRFARGLLDDRSQAEEVVGEVLVRVGRRWRSVRHDVPEMQVRRALVTACLARSRGVRPAPAAWGAAAAGADPGAGAAGTERHLLVTAVQRLPPVERAAVVSRCYEGMGDDQVAVLLGVTVPEARLVLRRALARVQALLAEHEASP